MAGYFLQSRAAVVACADSIAQVGTPTPRGLTSSAVAPQRASIRYPAIREAKETVQSLNRTHALCIAVLLTDRRLLLRSEHPYSERPFTSLASSGPSAREQRRGISSSMEL